MERDTNCGHWNHLHGWCDKDVRNCSGCGYNINTFFTTVSKFTKYSDLTGSGGRDIPSHTVFRYGLYDAQVLYKEQLDCCSIRVGDTVRVTMSIKQLAKLAAKEGLIPEENASREIFGFTAGWDTGPMDDMIGKTWEVEAIADRGYRFGMPMYTWPYFLLEKVE
jgi:hypothetical protein